MTLGAIGVIRAASMGSYLKYHEDVSSMLMASGFAVTAISYVAAMAIAP